MLEDFQYMAGLVIDWVRENPLLAAGAVVGVIALRWLLNRQTRLERESNRVLKDLTESEKGKYDDLRPLN